MPIHLLLAMVFRTVRRTPWLVPTDDSRHGNGRWCQTVAKRMNTAWYFHDVNNQKLWTETNATNWAV
jgi:hypothetical protein